MAFNISYSCMILTLFVVYISNIQCHSLSETFYANTCPAALNAVRTAIKTAVSREQRMAASLIRLHFHDCFVQGCDASIMLDDGPSIISEKNERKNKNSIRGFEVIDDAKARVESICPGIVSCADIIALAARNASVAAGGPTWEVKLGRRDSTNAASLAEVDANIPAFSDSLTTVTSMFASKGLTLKDMVALSGSHTIGQARCITFRDRIYNGTNIDANFATTLRRSCLMTADGDGNLAPLDFVTPNLFDNNYFKLLIEQKGVLASDQVLFNRDFADGIVTEYSKNPQTFRDDFAAAMVRMGDISPQTEVSQGVKRKFCNVV